MRHRHAMLAGAVAALLASPKAADAHTSEQTFVLLLPTDLYITSGVAAVALTVAIFSLMPERLISALFRSRQLFPRPTVLPHRLTSLLFLLLLAALLYGGFAGSRDPLENPLTLTIWTVWWIAFIPLQALLGDIWRWINPWTGLYELLRGDLATPGPVRLPDRLGAWPAIAAFFAFGCFYMAYPAPEDPERLAVVVGAYWLATFLAMLLFGGREWLERGECFTVAMTRYATLAAFASSEGRVRLGVPGWQLVKKPALPVTGAVFVSAMLATGSFDGLNETFWWFGLIGVNPLEFPGRSAVIVENVTGLAITICLLSLLLAAMIWLGLRLARTEVPFAEAFGRLAPSILPIALAYHFGHYLTSLLVNGQYVLAVINDPLETGASFLGLTNFHVTTGFFNSRDSVELIWLAQAGIVVLGHILAVLTAHSIAVDMLRDTRKATLSQLPLALFMIFYTLFGLWLLASPRGA